MNGIPRWEVEKFICRQDARVRAVERYDPSDDAYPSYYYFVVKPGDLSRQDVPH
jgi:hypothetical protein